MGGSILTLSWLLAVAIDPSFSHLPPSEGLSNGPLLVRTPVLAQGATLIHFHLTLITSAKILFPKKVTLTGD
jgi:hypothetical protein